MASSRSPPQQVVLVVVRPRRRLEDRRRRGVHECGAAPSHSAAARGALERHRPRQLLRHLPPSVRNLRVAAGASGPTEAFETSDGITKRYQMMVKGEGIIYWRKRSCWCLSCTDSLSRGPLEWGQDYTSEQCSTIQDESTGCDGDQIEDRMYSFTKKNCRKIAGPGVAMQAQTVTKNRNETASKLIRLVILYSLEREMMMSNRFG